MNDGRARLHSEVFMREDLAAMLRSIAMTANVTSSEAASPHAAAYRKGFAAALCAVATAVHIAPADLLPDGVTLSERLSIR